MVKILECMTTGHGSNLTQFYQVSSILSWEKNWKIIKAILIQVVSTKGKTLCQISKAE